MKLKRMMGIGALVLMMALVLSACTGVAQQPAAPAASGDGKLIVVITPSHDNPFFGAMADIAVAKAEELGNVDFTADGPAQFDAVLQRPILDAVVASKPDAICVAATDNEDIELFHVKRLLADAEAGKDLIQKILDIQGVGYRAALKGKDLELALGYSQLATPLRGFAPLLGVYGVSLAVAVTAGALAALLLGERRDRIVAAVIVLCVWGTGTALTRIEWTLPRGAPIRAALHGAIEDDDCGYADPAGLGATFAPWARATSARPSTISDRHFALSCWWLTVSDITRRVHSHTFGVAISEPRTRGGMSASLPATASLSM